ncbi:DUF974 domain protein [Rhizodiscina lignyota]|uniref:DUF974 domain protein n=1 Tax=Rhizodiscina lignyota TaxID=1504668 RepID=A0A9P4IHC6_9PEZI|nr:DUF974 domain protein [Rhizodiscina lignyota]
MAHARTHSTGEGIKGPHSISLKVLRLSRPSLSHQYPLPQTSKPVDPDELYISPLAALSVPAEENGADAAHFTLTPALTLPSAFASAYVGESFSCTLSANNELPQKSDRAISGVRITAQMQTPSSPDGIALNVKGGIISEAAEDEEGSKSAGYGEDLASGESLQRIIKLDLKEEGNHILAVTVTYTESQLSVGKGEDSAHTITGARVRTFRKLYQFVAQQLLSVRTKTGEVPGSRKGGLAKYVLEAQLENMGEGTVCLEVVNISAKPPFTSTSLNWDMPGRDAQPARAPLLSSRDVMQVAFLLQQEVPVDGSGDENELIVTDGKATLGQLTIQWRGHMGDRGSLSTGWLTAKAR